MKERVAESESNILFDMGRDGQDREMGERSDAGCPDSVCQDGQRLRAYSSQVEAAYMRHDVVVTVVDDSGEKGSPEPLMAVEGEEEDGRAEAGDIQEPVLVVSEVFHFEAKVDNTRSHRPVEEWYHFLYAIRRENAPLHIGGDDGF